MAFNIIEEVGSRHLHILWANGDPVTSKNMVMMYACNSMLNHWWDKVTVIIWGAPQLLLFEDDSVWAEMKIAEMAGVEFSACASCAENLNIKDKLEAEGVEVIRWGEKMTQLMQNGRHVLTV